MARLWWSEGRINARLLINFGWTGSKPSIDFPFSLDGLIYVQIWKSLFAYGDNKLGLMCSILNTRGIISGRTQIWTHHNVNNAIIEEKISVNVSYSLIRKVTFCLAFCPAISVPKVIPPGTVDFIRLCVMDVFPLRGSVFHIRLSVL